MNAVNFRITPKAGKTIKVEDQVYRLIGSAPYAKAEGELSVILTWESQCAECGETFTTTSALITKYLSRRCRKHRKAGRPVTKKSKIRRPHLA
jgi:hypothetical protein